jgi:benzoylformate decarboxylase
LLALRITDPNELKPSMRSAFSRPGAKLIEVVVSNAVN